MLIGPRTGEMENHVQRFWTREINGVRFDFVHVKVSRLGQPYLAVSRGNAEGTTTIVRCSCSRSDCPIGGSA